MRNAARALLLLFVFAVPWEYSLELGRPIGNIARAIGLIAIVASVLAVSRTGRIQSLGAVQWLTVTLYLWFCCSYIWTSTPNETAVKLRGYGQEMILVWLIWEFVESPDDLRNLMRAWLCGSWVLAILTVAAFVSADASVADQIRFAAIGQDPNDTARFVALGVPIAALRLESRINWFERVSALCYFPLALAAVLVTGSRSGVLIAIMAFAGSGIMMFRVYPKQALKAAVSFPVIAGAILASVPHGTLERFGTIAAQLQNGDLNQRMNIWSAGWRAFVEAPICGHGAGSFAVAARLFPEDTAHNTALGILVEGGLFALLLTTAIVAVSVRSVLKTRQPFRLGLWTLMAAWLIAGTVSTVGENRITWLLLGFIAVAERQVCREELASAEPIV
jgi:O-antigen ligase